MSSETFKYLGLLLTNTRTPGHATALGCAVTRATARWPVRFGRSVQSISPIEGQREKWNCPLPQ